MTVVCSCEPENTLIYGLLPRTLQEIGAEKVYELERKSQGWPFTGPLAPLPKTP